MNYNEFFSACKNDDIDKVKFFIEKGINIEAKEVRGIVGYTALHIASENCNPEIVKLLLEKSANIEAIPSVYDPYTPLTQASWHGCTEVVKILIKAGANVNTSKGLPLFWACYHGYIEVAKLLLDAGAKTNFKNYKEEKTVLMIAFEKRYTDVFNLLLDRGADISPLLGKKDNNCMIKKYYIYKMSKAKKRSDLLREELVAKYWHPENIEKWRVFYNKDFDEIQDIM